MNAEKEALPYFLYHPDPIATKAVAASDAICECCERARGYQIESGIYCIATVETLCPWCVADGSAARKYDGSFVQDIEGDVPPEVVDEIMHRTPGYISWQGENWLSHCGDACIFHGDFSHEDVLNLPAAAEAGFLKHNTWIDEKLWSEIKKYQPAYGDLSLYKFICRHCGHWMIGVDMG